LPRERFEHLADVLGVRGPDSTARQRGSQAPIQMVGAIEASEDSTSLAVTVWQGDDLQCPNTVAPKLPFGLSFRSFVQLVMCIALCIIVAMTWMMYRLGQKLCRCCASRATAPLKRSVATQSQTTYTAVAGAHHPRFKVLSHESGGAWRD
jgi:hypothetical protein